MKKPIQTYLSEDLIEALEAEAKKQSRSRNSMIEFILRSYLMKEGHASSIGRGGAGPSIVLYGEPITRGASDESDGMTASEYAAVLSKYSNPVDVLKEAAMAMGTRTVYVAICGKCKKENEVRKMFEEGVEYKICAVCALKAKLPWHKLEKL